jgi:hypothetical protein
MSAPAITLQLELPRVASTAQPTGGDQGSTFARPSSPPPAPFSLPDGGGTAGLSQLTLFGLFAAILAAIALAAQRLSRWLRLTPDLCRPLLIVSALERPG